MFFGLNNIFKKFLPKGLFYRSLIIVAAPIIVLQITVSIVFYDSIWIKANQGLTRSLVGELKTLSDIYTGNDQQQIDYLTEQYKLNFNFIINIKDGKLPAVSGERKYSPIDRSLRRELKSTFGSTNYWFTTTNYANSVEIKVKSNGKIIQIFFSKERIAPSSIRLFILWITLPSLLLMSIAIIFLKNQTRPIINLAKAAERFGKGDYINEFRPSGALEIRKAGYVFDTMFKRINRHLNQRSEMLSGISHDLRTPLTRLKLQLAMLNQKEISKKMSHDIDEMERMLNDYLQFAKTQSYENSIAINLKEFFYQIKKESNDNLYIGEINDDLSLVARKFALKRCFNNLIQNGLSYGQKVYIKISQSTNRVIVIIEDDGPGIPENEYKNVFKPFYRLDKSRNLNKSGIGLGLSISEDIVHSHGGSIRLSRSDKYKGLQTKVSLPS